MRGAMKVSCSAPSRGRLQGDTVERKLMLTVGMPLRCLVWRGANSYDLSFRTGLAGAAVLVALMGRNGAGKSGLSAP